MTTKDVIEKLREELSSSIEETEELTKEKILKLSQKLDKEILRYYSEENKER